MLGDNMLKKFSVKNYKKFKNEIEIDFTKTHDYKFNEYCISNGIITKSVMFGKNASGKSSFGYALFDIVMVLTDKHVTSEQKSLCMNVDTPDKYMSFKYTFMFDDKEVIYNYLKNEDGLLSYEEFFINQELVFSYDFTKRVKNFDNLKLIDAENLNFDYYEGNISVLRYIANNTKQKENSIVKQLVEFVSGMLWFRSLKNNAFTGLTEMNSDDYVQWIISHNKIRELERFLHDMSDIEIKFKAINLPGESLFVEEHKNGLLPFMQVASSGTIALTLLFYWFQNIDKISFLFIDEFDAFYHFKLSRKIIELFLDHKDTQVMFTSHNTYIASNDLLRPDCYFILNDGKISSIADLTPRELREAHNIEKMLRQGEFDV